MNSCQALIRPLSRKWPLSCSFFWDPQGRFFPLHFSEAQSIAYRKAEASFRLRRPPGPAPGFIVKGSQEFDQQTGFSATTLSEANSRWCPHLLSGGSEQFS